MRLSAFNKVKVHHIAKAQFAVEALVVVEVLDVGEQFLLVELCGGFEVRV